MARRGWLTGVLIGALAGAITAAAGVTAVGLIADDGPTPDFVTRSGDRFMLHGQPFAVAGSNNYRPMFLEPEVVDDIMRTAAANHFGVLRVWGFNDIGLADGTDSVDRQNVSTYFHYWDGDAPAYNDTETGLRKLDYVIASAKKHELRLVIPFVNNWASFGGMDQYNRWAGSRYHSDFYTDPKIKDWYRNWVRHLLERTNTHTGVKYKDEPTIAIWELANEARCHGSGGLPPAPGCNAEMITGWAREMAGYVKSIDRKHLLGFGDEGFLCEAAPTHWAYDCSTGVDARAIAAIDDVDMVGLHLYPDHWETDADWSTDYIARHLALARQVGKPVFLGEYGWRGTETRNAVFHRWLTEFQNGGGDIALYWIMQPRSDLITPPDSDGFTAYCPSPVCTQVSYRSQALRTGRTDFPPVPDSDYLLLDPGATGALDLLANDVSLFSTLDPASVDLDPAAPGAQTTLTVAGGTLALDGGTVTFRPAAGFTGAVDFTYTVADRRGQVSEPTGATVRVSGS